MAKSAIAMAKPERSRQKNQNLIQYIAQTLLFFAMARLSLFAFPMTMLHTIHLWQFRDQNAKNTIVSDNETTLH